MIWIAWAVCGCFLVLCLWFDMILRVPVVFLTLRGGRWFEGVFGGWVSDFGVMILICCFDGFVYVAVIVFMLGYCCFAGCWY